MDDAATDSGQRDATIDDAATYDATIDAAIDDAAIDSGDGDAAIDDAATDAFVGDCAVPPDPDAGAVEDVCFCDDEDGGVDDGRGEVSMECACAMGRCTPLLEWADETWIDEITYGCGLIRIAQEGGLSGISWTYDLETFELVGWSEGEDGPYGPCNTTDYTAGLHIGECDDRHSCELPAAILQCR